MSVRVMGAIWDLKMPATTRLVLLAIADHADHDGENAHPGVPLLASKTGFTERCIRGVIAELRAAGTLIATEDQPGKVKNYSIDLSGYELAEHAVKRELKKRRHITPERGAPLNVVHPPEIQTPERGSGAPLNHVHPPPERGSPPFPYIVEPSINHPVEPSIYPLLEQPEHLGVPPGSLMEGEVVFPSSPPPGPVRNKKGKADIQPEDDDARAMLAVFRAMFVVKGPAFTETMWEDHKTALRRAVRDGVTIECYRAACHGAKATWGPEYISPGSVARNVDRLSQYAAKAPEGVGDAKQTPLARSGETPFVPSLTAQKVTRDTELQMVHYTRLKEDPEYARDYYERYPERHPDYDDGEVTAPPRDADAERYNRMAEAKAQGA